MRFPWKRAAQRLQPAPERSRDGQRAQPAQERSRGGIEISATESRVGDYVTDGVALFRVEDVLASSIDGELFLQLEDCQTLELVLWPAESCTALQVRTVRPAATR
jgi:hypothetical protein